MDRSVRLLPISSIDDAKAFVEEIRNHADSAQREEFVQLFNGAFENWYVQELDGKAYLVAITEGLQSDFESGFSQYAGLNQPFFNWFRDRILEITGIDMREQPGGLGSEHIFEFKQNA